MTTLKPSLFTLSVIAMLTCSASANAQQPIVVAYRLSGWKTMEFENQQEAQQHLQTVQKLGCEATLKDHNGHQDVTYRLQVWTPLKLATEKLAHDWERWLAYSGFETVHGHGDDHAEGDASHNHAEHDHSGHNHGANGQEEIAYRLTEWKPLHFESISERDQMVAIAQGLGCDIREESHDGHQDLLIRSSTWKHAEFPTHAVAGNWEQWLRRMGFETEHEHGGQHNHKH